MDHPHYREHLTFLIEGGKSMAKAFPRAADRLASYSFDPDVERLLEGIAYISSKVTEKQEDSLAEICQLMFDILFPHYLCPIPSSAIVEFGGDPCTIHRQSEIYSTPVIGTSCCFRTIYETRIVPYSIEDVQWRQRGRMGQLTVMLCDTPGRVYDDSELLGHPVHMHLNGEPLVTRSLYQWLVTQLKSVELLDSSGRVLGTSESPNLHPLGLADEEALFPYPFGSFQGFRLLQEYFTLPQKFMFLSLEELVPLLTRLAPRSSSEEIRHFSLRFNLKVDAARSFMATKQNIRLNCVPVVNLFPHSADPIRRSPGVVDYQLKPAGYHLHYKIYHVNSIKGVNKKGTTRYPLLSELDLDAQGPFAQLRRKLHDGELITYISLSDSGDTPSDQTLITDLLCSNGVLIEGLKVGDICLPSAPYRHLWCKNITALTPLAPVPMGEELHWRLVKHMALSQRDLNTLDGLKDSIQLYNFHVLVNRQMARGHKLLLDSMLSLESKNIQFRYRRIPLWGQSNHLKVDESAFDSDGELFLFGTILDEFFVQQAPLNFFSELVIHRAQSQDSYRWPKRLGAQILRSS